MARPRPARLKLVGTVGAGVYTLPDTEELPNGVPFIYYVVAEFVAGSPTAVSDPSDPETITAVNDAPTPILDVVTTPQDTPVNIIVVGNDTDRDTAFNSYVARGLDQQRPRGNGCVTG